MSAQPVEPCVVTEAGVYDIPADVYHADPVPHGSLSSSGARKLLPPSCPALFRWDRDNPPPPRPHFDLGHAAHTVVLGDGPELVEVAFDDWRTNAAKAQRDEAHARGAVPLLTSDFRMVHDMAAALRGDPIAGKLFDGDGKPEQSLFYFDESTGVCLRARLDWLRDHTPGSGRLIALDYKSSRTANPVSFARSAADYGYHAQDAWYSDAILGLELAEDVAFVFVVQEKQPPYLVSVIELDAVARRIGRELNRRAIDLYAKCELEDRWPSYSDDVELVSLPPWIVNKFEGAA